MNMKLTVFALALACVACGEQAAPPDIQAAAGAKSEALLLPVAYMQQWVTTNYPSAYGWQDTFSGNNGQAYLRGSSCGVGQYNYYERKWIALSGCSGTVCRFDMQNCDGGCAVSGCTHYRYLHCGTDTNSCWFE